jgi:hypothetical protein
MLSGDDHQWNAKIALLLPSDHGYTGRERKGLCYAVLFEKDQVYIHSFAPFKKRLIATISILGGSLFGKKYLMGVENISKVGY